MSATTRKTLMACLLNRKEMVRAAKECIENYEKNGHFDEKIRIAKIRLETFEQHVKDLEEILTQTKG